MLEVMGDDGMTSMELDDAFAWFEIASGAQVSEDEFVGYIDHNIVKFAEVLVFFL